MLFLFAYIDPGAGLPFFSLWPIIVGFLFGLLGVFLVFVKRFFRLFRRIFENRTVFVIFGILIITAIITGVIMLKEEAFSKKVVVLGMDGLDPNILEALMEKAKLPNFAKLKDTGSYSRLKTVNPPQSEAAWSSFATGLNPGGHGIFDFIMRNPIEYKPYLSLTDLPAEMQTVTIGNMKIPVGWPIIKSRRKGIPFWIITSKKKIPTYIFFCPNTFPPEAVYGRMFSGMGTPDIRGTMGTFSFYTTAPLPKKKDVGGKVFHVEPHGNVINTTLYGPRDTSRRPAVDIKIPIKITLYSDSRSININIQGHSIQLKEKSWSNWLRLSFKLGLFRKVTGICRFYLKSAASDLELYCSAINFDPENPAFPISYPKGYSKRLVKEIGLYHTQGMPYDTWALNEGRIDEKTFLEQAQTVLGEREQILKRELKRFKRGVFFFYFGYPDSLQHMFWRFRDIKSPSYDSTLAIAYKDEITKCYQKMDELLGQVMEMVDGETVIIVLSDHGFGPFRRAVHLNSWLKESGFLCFKDGQLEEGREFFEDVNWSQTKAYALGFGGIYINQIGREGKGIVEPGYMAQEVKQAIIDKLSNWRDPDDPEQTIVKKIYTKEEIFDGPHFKDAPDLFVGFNIGYRASWQTALGAAPKNLIEDNLKKWSGDHLFDPSLVPGIFLINRKVEIENPNIIDIAPTILKLLGVSYEYKMDGKPFLIK